MIATVPQTMAHFPSFDIFLFRLHQPKKRTAKHKEYVFVPEQFLQLFDGGRIVSFIILKKSYSGVKSDASVLCYNFEIQVYKEPAQKNQPSCSTDEEKSWERPESKPFITNSLIQGQMCHSYDP